jgi:hypothetical protein
MMIPSSFHAYPSQRVFGIIDDGIDVDAMVAGLAHLGVDEDLWVLTGFAATRALDPQGSEHGIFAWLVRAVQKVGYESEQLIEYDNAARAGAWVIAVQLNAGGAMRDEVRDLFARHGGRNVRYFPTMGIEDMHLNAPTTAADAAADDLAATELANERAVAADDLATAALATESAPAARLADDGAPAPRSGGAAASM